MGQTLTHGIYLPDEGERNCYNGLAANWQLLDTSVGTIAEHTTALSGKAPLVHTHTKADITDFPAYGNAAGTICEGNDSRLSDARTPVAHTHTKSDVTDLLNSNFIPSANNSYDLGSSSYQWNNLYAKNYYYNGVAWGLDKDNTWSNFNRFNGYRLNIKNSSQEIGVIPTSNQWNGFQFTDKNNNQTVSFEHAFMGSGETRFKISIVDNVASNESESPVYTEILRCTLYSGGREVRFGADVTPLANNTFNLGTSTNKWKTLNGINPGALSLPDMGTTADVNYFDFISTITPLDGTDIFYRPLVDGWMTVIIAGTALSLFEDASSSTNHNQGSGISAAPVKGYCEATIPVHKNVRVKINAIGTSVYMAQVRPCMGNV